jgi:hypothetical protein
MSEWELVGKGFATVRECEEFQTVLPSPAVNTAMDCQRLNESRGRVHGASSPRQSDQMCQEIIHRVIEAQPDFADAEPFS